MAQPTTGGYPLNRSLKMKITHEVEQSAAKSDTRYYLNECAYVTTYLDKPVAIATDGKAMAIVPVVMEDGDTPGFIQADALKKARKLGSVSANGNLTFPDGSTMQRDTKDGARFPDFTKVIPAANSLSDVVLTFDADLFYRLAKAITTKSGKQPRRVELRIARECAATSALHLTGDDGAVGVLMPMR